MGNYLNNGQPKSHRTTSFKINFLTEVRIDTCALNMLGSSYFLDFESFVLSFCLAAKHDQNSRWEIHLSPHSGQVSVPTLPWAAQLFQRPYNSASGSQGYDDVSEAELFQSTFLPGNHLVAEYSHSIMCNVNVYRLHSVLKVRQGWPTFLKSPHLK